MKRSNKFLSLVLALCMILGMLPMNAFAVSPSTVSINFEDKNFEVGETKEFTVTTMANDNAGQMVLGTFTFSDPSAIEKLEYKEIQDGNWYELTGDFGPVGGFPMSDATSTFRVTFNKAGDYNATVSIVDAESRAEVCSTTANISVQRPNAGALTTDIGEKDFVVGETTEFTFTTVANGDAGTMVLGSFEFDDPSAIEKLEYKESKDGQWYEFYGDFGPGGGFPMTDATSLFRVTFNKVGSYTVTASMKKADGTGVLCTTGEITLTVVENTHTVTFDGSGVVSFTDISGNAIIDNQVTVEDGDSVSFKIVAEGYEVAVYDNGTAVEAIDGVYTLSSISDDHEVTVAAVDIAVPVFSAVTVSNANAWANKKTITFSVTDNAGAEGITTYVSLTDYADKAALDAGGENSVASGYEVTANGTYYIYAVDIAGNFTKTSVTVSQIDTVAPKIVGKISTNSGLKNTTFTFSVEDEGGSGIASVKYSKNSDGSNPQNAKYNSRNETWSFKDTKDTVYYIIIVDNAGNTKIISTDGSSRITVTATSTSSWDAAENTIVAKVTTDSTDDTSIQKVVCSKDEEYDENSTSNVDITNSLTDGKYYYRATANGIYYIHVIDTAGNSGSAEVEVKNIDTDKPTIQITEKQPNSEWANSEVVISGFVSDTQSGVVQVVYGTDITSYPDGNYNTAALNLEGTYSFTIPAEEFNGTYYVWAIDAVGRISDPAEVSVKVDTTVPANIGMSYVQKEESGFIRVLNTLSFGLLFKDQIYINVTATDNRPDLDSGIAKYQYQMVAEGDELSDDNWVDYVSSDEEVEIQLDVSKYENFRGKVYVRVWDVAGNASVLVTDTQDGTTVILDNADMAATPSISAVVDADEEYNGKWTNKDVTITLGGGETYAGVMKYEYRIDYIDGDREDSTWTEMPGNQIVIDSDTNATYYFRSVAYTDNCADHKLTPGGEDGKSHVVSNEVNVEVKVQKTLPQNAKVLMAAPNGNNGWYVGAYPTIEMAEPSVSAYAAQVSTFYKIWNTTDGKTENDAEEVRFTGSNVPQIEADGEYVLKVWTVDEAGNICSDNDIIRREINVDITFPTLLEISIDGVSIIGTDSIAFDKFYQNTVVVKLSANCDISGLKSLQYQKVNAVSDYRENGTWTAYDAENGIVINPSEKFVIYFRAEDVAGNVSIINSTGIVVDNKAPTGETNAPEIDITPSKPNENGIHNGDVVVDLNVIDPRFAGAGANESGFYSGLNKITYRIYTTDTDAIQEGVLLDLIDVTEGAIYDSDNLVSGWSGKITIDAEKFNSNNVIVEVSATDNAGNVRTSSTAAGDIKIDITAPKIHISYNNNTPDSGKYYSNDRTATITVTERNFKAEDVKVTITNTDGTIPTLSAWTEKKGTGNMDDTTYTATITYHADGDYKFAIEYTDLAGWINEAVNYGGSATPTEFTIDQTNPVIRVSYDNNEAANGNYFNATRTATITITEHNFDVDRVTFTRNANRGGTNPNIAWTNNGDTHTATISYTADGDYTFDVTMTDMAGNNSGAADFGNSVAGKDFVIDTTFEDMITIGGVDNGKAYGYRDNVIPTIDVSDINLDAYTVTLIGVQKDTTIDLTKEVNDLLNVGGEKVTGTFDIFEVIQDMDGIYTLSVTSQDKAGNQDAEEITFTVNRFGSVYVYNEYLMNLIANGGAYVQDIHDDLVITEYNADKLVSDSLVIQITCDGKPLENVIYEVTPELNDTVAVGESGWYQYKYTISKDNFASDGVYKISVSTKDATGNTPENSRYEDLGITFRVDSTLAEISSIVGLEDPIINATEQVVKYTVYDTMGIKSIKIYVDGKLVDEITDFSADLNNYSGSFTLSEQNAAQRVRIVVEDMSGNITDTDAEGFSSAYEFNRTVTVSTNFFVRWFANKPLFWGSIGGVVVLIGGLWFFLIAKRKKKEEEKATAK